MTTEEKIEQYEKDKCKAFGIVMGQCLELTKEMVKTDKSFKDLEEADNVKGLLDLIRDLCYGTDKKRYIRWVQQAQLRKTVTMTQGPTESLQRFATNFLAQVKAMEDVSGPLVPVKDVVRMVQRTRVVGEGDEAVTETYNTVVLANEDVIEKARDHSWHAFFSQEWTETDTRMLLMR